MSDETVVDVPAVPGPGIAGQDPHSHPLPAGVRVLLVLFGLCLGIVFTMVLLLIGGADERAAEQVAEAKRQVMAELDQRTAARNESDAEQEARVRSAVCTVLPDLPSPSEDVQRLADALGCPVAAAGRAAPHPSPPQNEAAAPATPQQQPSASSPGAEPDTAQPTPAPRAQPAPATPAQPGAPAPAPDDPDDEPPAVLPPVTCTVPLLGPVICS